MRQWNYARAAREIQNMYPEIFQQVIEQSTPVMKNTSVIPAIYEHYLNINPSPSSHDKDGVFMNKIIFISSILNLYCPSALYHNCRVTDRICSILANAMGYNVRQSVSAYVSQARAYVKNPHFRERVEGVCKDIEERFKDVKCAPVSNQVQYNLFE